MSKKLKNNGFSLMEVLLSVGILAVGMSFVAGSFSVALYFTTVSTERTTAAVVADEAFAKIRLHGVDPNMPSNQQTVLQDLISINNDEFLYPSDANAVSRQYYWQGLCRRVGPADVQVTVFVCRIANSTASYRGRNPLNRLIITVSYPMPVFVSVSQPPTVNADELLIIDLNLTDIINEATFVNDGYTIVDNQTGDIYRVLERDRNVLNQIILDRPWQGGATGSVWVISPSTSSGRYPCIAIYQKVIRF